MLGDYSSPTILLRNGALVAVVDSCRPELFLPALEISRPALRPEVQIAGPKWPEKALASIGEYCHANSDIGRSNVRSAPHVWAIQLIRSEHGLRQHYFGPVA